MRDSPGLTKYPNVFSPITLGPVEVPNRIFIPPHGIALQAPVPGHEAYFVPSSDFAYYYAERAAGGVGLLFHSMHVGPVSKQPVLATTPWFEEGVPAFARVAELVHEHGAKIMAEIWYSSHRPKLWEAMGPDAPILSPSVGQGFGYAQVRKAMSKDEIRRIVEMHAVTTRRLRDAGYDGVEIHACHGVLLNQFLSPYFNRREDEYGGSLENRCLFLVECLEAIASEKGSELAVGVRVNADEWLPPHGVDAAGTRDILRHLAPTGLVDFVDLDCSVEPEQQHLMTTTFFEPKLHNLPAIEAVSSAGHPELVVIAAPGRVTHIAEAESLLERGVLDMVGINRGHIAEPRLMKNAIEGKEQRSRVCIASNHCMAAGWTGTFGCAINAAAGKEERFGSATLVAAPRRMQVVVVGGGPAGLEAARVAAVRGHAVTLLERRTWLGGALDLWARIPGREHLRTLRTWFERELNVLEVDVRLGIDADATTVLELAPDAVVLASGGRYSPSGESGFQPTGIAGTDQDFVVTPEAVLEHGLRLSGRVLVLDEEGMHAAVGVAEIAAAQGAEVEYVTRHMTPAPDLGSSYQLGYVVGRLKKAGIAISTSTFVKQVDGRSVVLVDTWSAAERSVAVDTLVLGTMRLPVDGLSAALEGQVPYLYVIGDALAPRGLREATYEGHRFGRVIGEPEMPADVTDALFTPTEAARSAAFA